MRGEYYLGPHDGYELIHDTTGHPSMTVLRRLTRQSLVLVTLRAASAELLQHGVHRDLKKRQDLIFLSAVFFCHVFLTSRLAELDTPPPSGTEPRITASKGWSLEWKWWTTPLA